MYCTKCGKEIQERARFCDSCGTAQGAPESKTLPQQVTGVVVKPKRGGWLAVKGFAIAVVLVAIGNAALTRISQRTAWTGVALGIGAAYIISNLRKWNRQKEEASGTGIAWVVAVIFLISCIGSLASSRGFGNAVGSSNPTANPADDIDPKVQLLENVSLEFQWKKDGFGNIMMADFTIKNPTKFRFKDFEIKCTHSAASGTVIDSNTKTLYEIVEPNSTKHIPGVNMGLIDSQATASSCAITDLVVAQ